MKLTEKEQELEALVIEHRNAGKADLLEISVDCDPDGSDDGKNYLLIELDDEIIAQLVYDDDRAYDVEEYLRLLRYNKIDGKYVGYFGKFRFHNKYLDFCTGCGPNRVDGACPSEVEDALEAALLRGFAAASIAVSASESSHAVTCKEGDDCARTQAKIIGILVAAGWKQYNDVCWNPFQG